MPFVRFAICLSHAPVFFCVLGMLLSTGIIPVSVLAETAQESVPPSDDGEEALAFDRILFQGNRTIDGEALRTQLNLVPPQATRAGVAAQIKNFFETGFFDQVTARVERSEDGIRSLLFIFSEKPTVRKVFIKGNEEIDEKDLTPVFKFEGRKFLDGAAIQLMIRQAKAFYQSKGFYHAEFEHAVTPVGENQVDITFTVQEGKRLKIREVEFRGLDKIDESDLTEIVQTQDYKWWSSWLFGTGRLNEEALQNDRMIIRQYFLDNGFLDGTVSEPSVEIRDDGIYISFDIKEGDLYSVAGVDVDGDLIDNSKEATLEGIELEKGETFKADTMRNDVFRITEKFTERGYAFANVVPDTLVNAEDRSVKIQFNTQKGEEVFVDRIQIRGNSKTYDNVIRRELRIVEGDKYSSKKINRSKELLQRLGYFEEVDITTDAKEGSSNQVDLNVNVREAPTGTFSVGAGYSSDQGTLFNARLSENNVLGTGKAVSFNADLGAQRENFLVSYRDRRFNDSFWQFGVEASMTEWEFLDFNRETSGGSTSIGYPLEEFFGEWSQDVAFSVDYEYLDINISDVDPTRAAQLVVDSQGSSSASAITPALVRNTINNPLNPTEGSRQSISMEMSGLGGTEEYYLFSALQQLYYPIWKREEGGIYVFSWRTRFGYGENYSGDEPFPLFRRFFPGGINSVRGFEARTMGPRDENGFTYGGNKQLINNVELIFPVMTSAGLNAVVFYDVGDAFDDDVSIEFSELRQAYGFGLRWNSPMGPIRVEFGFPIDRRAGEDSMVTLFSFGAPL